MIKLVLLRHGESTWNKENLYTGWTDVDLSEKGLAEAHEAGRLMKAEGFNVRPGLHVATQTSNPHPLIALDEMDQMWLPITNTWRLNERHYGVEGLNKAQTAEQYGDRAG